MNININVLYFAELREITNRENESFNLINSNIEGLIKIIFEKYPNIKEIIWDQDTQCLKSSISVIINHKSHNNQCILEKKLNDGDSVAFLLPVSGG